MRKSPGARAQFLPGICTNAAALNSNNGGRSIRSGCASSGVLPIIFWCGLIPTWPGDNGAPSRSEDADLTSTLPPMHPRRAGRSSSFSSSSRGFQVAFKPGEAPVHRQVCAAKARLPERRCPEGNAGGKMACQVHGPVRRGLYAKDRLATSRAIPMGCPAPARILLRR